LIFTGADLDQLRSTVVAVFIGGRYRGCLVLREVGLCVRYSVRHFFGRRFREVLVGRLLKVSRSDLFAVADPLANDVQRERLG
jgi:hypothetical protein